MKQKFFQIFRASMDNIYSDDYLDVEVAMIKTKSFYPKSGVHKSVFFKWADEFKENLHKSKEWLKPINGR